MKVFTLYDTFKKYELLKDTDAYYIVKFTREQFYAGEELEDAFSDDRNAITHIVQGFDKGHEEGSRCICIYYANGDMIVFGDEVRLITGYNKRVQTEEEVIEEIERSLV